MTISSQTTPDAQALVHEAASILTKAIEKERTLHLPGVRDRYREQLENAISMAGEALGATDDAAIVLEAQRLLTRAHAGRAEDARYGAGQLSRGSQRAPTLEDCDDGWERVCGIIKNAEESARHARRFANELDEPAAHKSAKLAEAAAKAARQIADERNDAYTFHTDPGFSFGEGWHLAAAAALAGVSIQIKPDGVQAAQAKRFLSDAGLSACLTEYRPRPRNPKQLTAIVADAFRVDPARAQRTVREAFLGTAPPSQSLVEWTRRVVGDLPNKTVLLWSRQCAHDAERNTASEELFELATLALAQGLTPVFFGDAIGDGIAPKGSIDMTLSWKEPLFQGEEMRRAQLKLFEVLMCNHGLVGQMGVTTAGMDGPALMGLATLYITQSSNVRMGRWVGVVPHYQEVIRQKGYLEAIRRSLEDWQQR